MRSQLALSWGIETFKAPEVEHTDEMVRQVDENLLEVDRVQEGDLVVIIAGSPPGIPAPPTPCGSTGWATRSTGQHGVPAGSTAPVPG